MEGVFAVQAIISLVDSITGPLRGVDRQLDSTEGRAMRLGQRMGQLAKSMLPIAAVAGMLLLGFGGMVSKAIAFESAMADVNKVLNLSNGEFQAMSDEILALSTRIPLAADGLAAIVESAGQSGVAKADLLVFAEQAAKMGVAFGLAGDQAGKTMSDWRAGMGLTLERTYALADAVNHLSNNMNATAPALSEVIQRSGALAMQTGLAEQSVAALGAAFLAAGATPEVASTALSNFTGALVMGSAATERQVEAFRSLGFEATQLASDMQRDAEGTIMNVLGAIASKPKELQLSIATEVFGKESLKAIAPLLANTDLLRQAFSLVGDQANYAGSMQAEFDTRSKTVGNTLILLRNKLNAVGIVIGTALLPIMGAGARVFGLLVDGLLALAKTPVGQAIITVAGALSAGVLAITAFAAASWAASAVLPLLGGALAAISWPIWLIVAAVGVLALAWQTNFGGMADTLARWWGNIQLVHRGVVAVFETLTDGTGSIHGELARDIEAAGLVGLVTTVARIAYRVREFWLGMTEAISTAWDTAVTNISPVLSALGDSFGWLAELLGMAVSALFGFGAASDVSAWRIAGEVVGTLLGGAFQMLATAIRIATIPLRVVGGLLGFIVNLANGMDLAEAGSKLITTFWEGIKSEAGALYENFKSLLGPLAQLLPHSDAKEGPLSTLTASGAAIPDTMGEGVRSAAPRLAATMAGALGGLTIAGATPAPALAEAPAAPEIRVEAPAPTRSGRQSGRQIIIQRLEVKLEGVQDADAFLTQLARFVEAHDG